LPFFSFLKHIPLTGRNLSFRERVIGNKPYVYVLNKADCADLSQIDKVKAQLHREGYSPSVLTILRDTKDKNTRTVSYLLI
jgi:ribosome biogenesis GTPase A